MSHHNPDLAVVACVGCGELVDEADVVHDAPHVGLGCCHFHPYHAWCYRAAPPDPRPWTRCADCGLELATAEVLGAARWLAAFNTRLHRNLEATAQQGGANALRPSALRFVRVRQRGAYESRLPQLEPLFDGVDRDAHDWLGRNLEIVHASGCVGEPDVVSRLRSAPADLELRVAYAAELERAGDAARASFVQHEVAKRRGESFDRGEERLRNLRESLPSSWREAVARRHR